MYEIKTKDFYKDISGDVRSKFDTSNYPGLHQRHRLKTEPKKVKLSDLIPYLSGIPTNVNKKVLGMMKDEAGGKQIVEFVGLRSKLRAERMDKGYEEKKCKGVKKEVVKNEITFDDYRKCLFSGIKQLRAMNTFRSRQHEIKNGKSKQDSLIS